jgi:hypothetical protein
MTHRRFLITACAALGAALMHSTTLTAQQGAPTQPPLSARRGPDGPGPRRGPPNIDERVARMTTELGLSPDQAAKVKVALTAQQRSADSILARRAAQQDAERAAMLAMHTSTEKALTGILTADQKMKHDAMRARQGGPGGGRGHGGRGRRGAGPDRRDDRRGRPDDDRRGR